MKIARVFLALLLCITLALTLPSCKGKDVDLFAPFRAAYTADIEGEANGVVFSARLVASPVSEDGTRSVTLTFYAPQSLFATTLTRRDDGSLTLSSGGVTLEGMSGDGFLPLLLLFPITGEVQEVSLTDEGHTLVKGADFTLELLADGTPYRASNATVSATIVSFSPS